MPDDLLIRPANPRDTPAIAAIHAETWRVAYRGILPVAYLDALSAESRLPMWEDILTSRHPGIQVWVAAVQDTVVGFASTNPVRDEPGTGQLATIYLHPTWMHQGIGRILLAQAEAGLAAQGFQSSRLAVLRDNHPTRRFYERAGWSTDGEEICDEVHGVPVIELVYRKVLTGTNANGEAP